MKLKDWLVSAAAAAAMFVAPPVPAQGVEAGVQAGPSGSDDDAVRRWRPLADRGDPEAQLNLGHAYRLGRGVPRDMNLAEQYYERAARAGQVEAQAMYGLILIQSGRHQEGMRHVQGAAERGDARAQYVYGTALFNGDVVARDWPRAWAFMTRAAGPGLPYARSQLAEMERQLSEQDRSRGAELARTIEARPPTRVAAAAEAPPARTATRPAPPPAPPMRVADATIPPSSAAERRPAQAATPAAAAPVAAVPAVPAAANGRWRVQLGAFSSEANARRAWNNVSGRLPGLQPAFVRAGNLIRLQAGPLPNRAAAARACASLNGQACFPVSS